MVRSFFKLTLLAFAVNIFSYNAHADSLKKCSFYTKSITHANDLRLNDLVMGCKVNSEYQFSTLLREETYKNVKVLVFLINDSLKSKSYEHLVISRKNTKVLMSKNSYDGKSNEYSYLDFIETEGVSINEFIELVEYFDVFEKHTKEEIKSIDRNLNQKLSTFKSKLKTMRIESIVRTGYFMPMSDWDKFIVNFHSRCESWSVKLSLKGHEPYIDDINNSSRKHKVCKG